MNEVFRQIEKIFNKNKLIGNYDFTEEEYSRLVDYVGYLCNSFIINNNKSFPKDTHNIIFATLVEITKRWKETDVSDENEENSSFWAFIFKILIGEENDQKLYAAFTSIISQIGSQQILPIVKTGKKYYATLMMHSFAPRKSIYSFFDLCYNVFKKDLDFGFTSDDEWLCEIVAEQMKNVLGGGYREDKLVSIGSSAYSIKIGLRSFVLNESLSVEFNKFIKETFYNINKLFNREIIFETTRLERYMADWWKNKSESEKIADGTTHKKRIPTVSKQDITAKFIKNDNEILLCIPSIRTENSNSTMRLLVYVNEKQFCSEEMRTKRGELVVATKPRDFKLNDLLELEKANSINTRVVIKENETIIFDSEKSKTTSLKRDFILFDDEKEIFSQINKPTNYFVYSPNIDTLKSVPDELTTYGGNLYNIYPNAGESLIGETKQVFFVDKTKTASLGKNACLIGSIADVEWILDDISCIVYKNAVKLMIPENFNLKALELRIDNKQYKLQELNYEQIELNCYQFGLKALGLISEDYPTKISLYSYEKETTLFTETIIVLPSLDIQFNNPFYYGNLERKVIVSKDNETIELSWNNQESEIICPFNEDILVIKIPYLKWRINGGEWHNEPINKKLWCKDFLQNGDFLEIDNPKENETISISGKADGKSFEITKNQSGKFEIGRAIFANENKTDISVRFFDGKNRFDLFCIATKEHFVENPVIYRNGKVFWIVEDTFLGNKNNIFLLDVGGKKLFRDKIDGKNKEIVSDISEDIYKVKVKIKDKNIFSKEDKYDTIFEGDLTAGIPEKFRFKGKYINVEKINTVISVETDNSWATPKKTYIIRDLEYLERQDDEQTHEYYIGKLKISGQENLYVDYLDNEKGEKDQINPVRIELRSNNSFWLVAGYDKENDDFLGELIFDTIRCELCNINSTDTTRYRVANLYKFKEEEYV